MGTLGVPFLFWGGKNPKLVEIWLRHMHRKYILKKKMVQNNHASLSNGQAKNDTPIWGYGHQLDDLTGIQIKMTERI